MARRRGSGSLLGWGLIAVGSYVGYTKARAGDFGPSAQQFAGSIHNTFGKLGLTWGNAAPSTGQLPVGSAVGTCQFISYQQSPTNCRYVAVAEGGNGFVMVWRGRGANYATQAAAEAAYNAKVASEGCY